MKKTTLHRGLTWQQSWAMRLSLLGSHSRLPRGFESIKVNLEGPEDQALVQLGRSVVATVREALDALEPSEAAMNSCPAAHGKSL